MIMDWTPRPLFMQAFENFELLRNRSITYEKILLKCTAFHARAIIHAYFRGLFVNARTCADLSC